MNSKKMNKKFLFTILIFSTLTLILNSCSKENDPTPVTTTSSSPNAKFLGKWYISEKSTQYGSSTYYVTIADSTNNAYVLLERLYNFNTNTKATTLGNNITIPSQIIEGTSVSGSGTLVTSTRINLTYYVNDGYIKDTVTAVLTK